MTDLVQGEVLEGLTEGDEVVLNVAPGDGAATDGPAGAEGTAFIAQPQ